MRILYHHRTQMDDAQGIHIMEMVEAFRGLGHEVEIFSLVKKNPKTEEKTAGKGWETLTRLVPKWAYEVLELGYNAYAFVKLAQVMKRWKPDFVYERYAMFNFCGALAARRYKVPFFLEVNSPLYLEKLKYDRLIFRRLARRIENWTANAATRTVVVSSKLRDILAGQGVRVEKMAVVPNGINPHEFNLRVSGQAVRDKYAIGGDETVVGVVGWFRDWHGLDFLVQTCTDKDVFRKRRVRLLFVGDGPAVPQVCKLAESLGVADRVTFTGAVDRKEVPSHVAAIDIALQPRVTAYASPMKLIEYMALGKVIVAPRQQNIQDVLADGVNALLFKPEDREDLFSKLEIALGDAEMSGRMGRAAAQTIVEKNLVWQGNARRVIGFLQGGD